MLGAGHEGVQELLLRVRAHGCSRVPAEALLRAAYVLSNARLRLPSDVGDLLVRVVKRLTEEVRRPFGRRQLLEHQLQGELDGFAALIPRGYPPVRWTISRSLVHTPSTLPEGNPSG